LVLIDGEHYADVVRDALDALPYDVVGALFVGGTEKLRGGEDYGVPLVSSLDEVDADLVYDLSDEPVLSPRARMLWASRALALGLPYAGADFRFDPPSFAPFPLPSVSVIGTGKRVGKTAVTSHLARLLARDRDVVVVSMGRGGPPRPEVAEVRPTVDALVELSRAGRHAASDYLETAALAGVPTIGCRRAGGGIAGAVADSNVLEGAQLALERSPDVVVFDGSGAALPPVATTRRLLVAADNVAEGLNPYRVLISDLVLVLGQHKEAARLVRDIAPDARVLEASLRLRPLGPLDGRVAVFTAGPADVSHIDHVFRSTNLARRDALRAELAALDADTYLVEIKAAAIDVVAEDALARGRRVVFADNEVVGDGVDEALLALVAEAAPAPSRRLDGGDTGVGLTEPARSGGAGFAGPGAGQRAEAPAWPALERG
jgi:cyclic 2,3-diphosphoglycerate synthetase